MPRKPVRNLAQASAIGTEFVGFALVGIFLDYSMGNFRGIPWATFILAPLGVLVAFFHLYQLVKQGPNP
jgi:F0F1-type ATP synthase assembly protein I